MHVGKPRITGEVTRHFDWQPVYGMPGSRMLGYQRTVTITVRWLVIVGNDIEYFGTWDDAMLWVSNYLDKIRAWESIKGKMQEQRAKAGLPEEPILRPDAFIRMAMDEYMGRAE